MVKIKRRYTIGIQPEGSALGYPITSLTSISPTTLSKPNYLEEVIDPVFPNTIIKRISNSTEFGLTGSYILDTGYSKRQPWTRGMSYMMVGNRHLLNGSTHEYIRLLDTSYKLVSNVDDTKIYCFYKNGSVKVYNPFTNTYSANIINLATSLSGYDTGVDMFAGNYEGNISADDTRFILNCSQSGTMRNVVVNLVTGDIINNFSDADLGLTGTVDWVSFSPSGNYIITNQGTGTNKKSYSASGTLVNNNLGGYSHRDIGYDANNVEILSATSNPVQHNIITGSLTQVVSQATMDSVFNTNTSGGHSSMRASLGTMKGWILISMTSDLATYREIFWVKTDGSQQVMRVCDVRLSNTHGNNGPQACPSWDGKQILFASDWNNGTGSVDAYIAKYTTV